MVDLILSILNVHKNKILLQAEAALPESQFKAFRKLFLDEFGMSGFEGEIRQLLRERNLVTDWEGREYTLQERRCSND